MSRDNSLALYEIQERDASKSWLAVLSIDRAICRALQKAYYSTLIRASFSFFWTLICGHNGHWTRQGENLGTRLSKSRTGTRIANIVITFTQTEGTPLMNACLFGSTATARVLLEHGASIDRCERKVRDLQHA